MRKCTWLSPELRQRYLSPSEAESAIWTVIHAQRPLPSRVLDTTTGLLCDREAQTRIFKTSTEYKELEMNSTLCQTSKLANEINQVTFIHLVAL
jgi:hypothetical protein